MCYPSTLRIVVDEKQLANSFKDAEPVRLVDLHNILRVPQPKSLTGLGRLRLHSPESQSDVAAAFFQLVSNSAFSALMGILIRFRPEVQLK